MFCIIQPKFLVRKLQSDLIEICSQAIPMILNMCKAREEPVKRSSRKCVMCTLSLGTITYFICFSLRQNSDSGDLVWYMGISPSYYTYSLVELSFWWVGQSIISITVLLPTFVTVILWSSYCYLPLIVIPYLLRHSDPLFFLLSSCTVLCLGCQSEVSQLCSQVAPVVRNRSNDRPLLNSF